MKPYHIIIYLSLLILVSINSQAQDLLVSKACPVFFNNHKIGLLAFSIPWYHDGGTNASYIAKDDSTGIGIEVHFLVNQNGKKKRCDRYRMIQFRSTNAKLDPEQEALELDIPKNNKQPFYDAEPLEFGHGMHLTPTDTTDKPWNTRIMRASAIAIYDTPYVSDYYGIKGQNIIVKFNTCVVCQKYDGLDTILSCGSWGFNREYMGGMTAWSEPEADKVKCHTSPGSKQLNILKNTKLVTYQYGKDWN